MELKTSRQRLRAIYQNTPLPELGELFGRLARSYLDTSLTAPEVSTSISPASLQAAALQHLEAPASTAAEFLPRYQKLAEEFLGATMRLHSPRYMGHQVSVPPPVAAFFSALTAVSNQSMAVGEMAPGGVAIERALVKTLGSYTGWPAGFDGFATGGGTLANVTALLAAREILRPGTWKNGLSSEPRPLCFITGADSHYSVARAAGIMGLGTDHVWRARLDAARRIDVQHVEDLCEKARAQGRDILAIVATAGTTAVGAFDDIAGLAEVAKRYGVWLHIDGAHGASLLLSPAHRELLKGIEQADSLTWDGHKMLFAPSLSTFLLFRRWQDSFRTFSQDAPYLLDAQDSERLLLDGGLRTLECTKSAMAVPLWGIWSMYGAEFFTDLLNVNLHNTRVFYDKLLAAPDFRPMHVPQCNILCFQYTPQGAEKKSAAELSALQVRVRKALHEKQEFYLTQTVLDGATVLRVTLMNPLIEDEHLDEMLAAIRRI